MGYQFIEHTADLGIRVRAQDLSSLFREAGLALVEIVGAKSRKRPESLDASIGGLDQVDLLVRWLQELLYLIEVKHLRIGLIEIRELSETRLKALISGRFEDTPLDREIKAVTYHNLDIRTIDGAFEASIIFDT
jgi:SHS2 domain-containing protein